MTTLDQRPRETTGWDEPRWPDPVGSDLLDSDLLDSDLLDEAGLDIGPERLWPGRNGWRPAPQPVSPAPPATPPPRRARRRGALLVTLALVGGGVAGAVAARLTTRPETTTSVSVTAPATTARTSTTSAADTASARFDVPAVIEKAAPSVVTIDVRATARGPWGRTYQEEGAGTGFVLSADGLIATNAHVIEGAESIMVTLSDGTELVATVVGTSSSADLAVLHVDRLDLVPLAFGSSASLRVGTAVVAVGNALALEGGPTASFGIISAKGRMITTTSGTTYENLLQTDAAINSGDSGGPLLDSAGRVVGINTAGTTQAENIGFAIPIDDAGPVLESLAAAAAA